MKRGAGAALLGLLPLLANRSRGGRSAPPSPPRPSPPPIVPPLPPPVAGPTPEPLGTGTTERWEPSPATLAASQAIPANAIPYNGGGPWNQAACATEAKPHAQELARILRATFPWLRTIGTVRCSPLTVRHRDGTTEQRMSIHAIGRALDAMVPSDAGPEGTQLADWLVANAERYGIQLVIWNRIAWQPSMATERRFQAYTGRSPHVDHVHIEVTATPSAELRRILAAR